MAIGPDSESIVYRHEASSHSSLGSRAKVLRVPRVEPRPQGAVQSRYLELSGATPTPTNAVVTRAFQAGPQTGLRGPELLVMPRAGPHSELRWDPKDSRAIILNCGGLCPGLNAVIRELVVTLHDYGCERVSGIKGGYAGVVDPEGSWIDLTPSGVSNIHKKSGTVLQSARGNPPHSRMAEVLRDERVTHVFVIGGDGSQKGAMQIYEAARDIGYEVCVCGVPKTIDNDIALLDCTFGFNTAVAEATRAIDTAYTEAQGNADCIGLVKLMGRHSGSLALHATLAARHVDLCLIPEMDIDLGKCLDHLVEVQRRRGGAVVVVAEGLGDTLLQSGAGVDAGGNKVLEDVGPWFKERIQERFASEGMPLSIKYIDPGYSVRSAEPDTFDQVYCATLATNAVHGAMAGYTAFCVGQVDGQQVMLPIPSVTGRTQPGVDTNGDEFARMVYTTLQPPLKPDAGVAGEAAQSASKPWPFRCSWADFEVDLTDELESSFQHLSFRRCLVERHGAGALASSHCSPLKKLACSHDLPIFHSEELWLNLPTRLGDGAEGEQLTLLRAGPRERLRWDPTQVRAVVLNCGGLCPGANSVIRELVMMLDLYGCRDVWGVHGGFEGVGRPELWEQLRPEDVRELHLEGGCRLRSRCGRADVEKTARICRLHGVSHVYVLGGSDAHECSEQLSLAAAEVGHEVSVCAIPKTIDSDLALLDFTFGHNSAVAQAKLAVDAAYAEASGTELTVGLAKVPGEHAGFVALHATLASRQVDLCLIPEMAIDFAKCAEHIVKVHREEGRGAVVVLASGVRDTLYGIKGDEIGEDTGLWFQKQLQDELGRRGSRLSVRYLNESSMVRATLPDPIDSAYCTMLAHNAVHGCMAGYTSFTVGKIDNQHVMLPIGEVVKRGLKTVNVRGKWFSKLMCTTKQPADAAGAPSDVSQEALAQQLPVAAAAGGGRRGASRRPSGVWGALLAAPAAFATRRRGRGAPPAPRLPRQAALSRDGAWQQPAPKAPASPVRIGLAFGGALM